MRHLHARFYLRSLPGDIRDRPSRTVSSWSEHIVSNLDLAGQADGELPLPQTAHPDPSNPCVILPLTHARTQSYSGQQPASRRASASRLPAARIAEPPTQVEHPAYQD